MTNLVKGVQLNTNTTQSSQNPNPGAGQLLPKTKILHLHLKAEVVEMVEVEVEEVSDLGQVKSCAIGVKILFLKRKLVTKYLIALIKAQLEVTGGKHKWIKNQLTQQILRETVEGISC